jgi:hypothetical protein
MLVTSNLSITSKRRLGALGFPPGLPSLCRCSRRRLSSLGSRNLGVLSRTEVSEFLLDRRSRDLSDGSAKMLSSPGGPLGLPGNRRRSSSEGSGPPRDVGGTFSALVLALLDCAGGGGGGRLFGASEMVKFSWNEICQPL